MRRLDEIPGFGIDRVAAAAGDDPEILRLESLDTDVPPPAAAIAATRDAVGEDDANSWLPFTGRQDLKEAVSDYIERRGGPRYEPRRDVVITGSEVEHSIVLAGSSIRDLDARMEASLLGKNVSLSRSKGLPKTLRFLVGDNADIEIP